MFAASPEVLKAREGFLAEVPLPLLLHALLLEEWTCVLEVTQRQLEKRIYIEDGSPVGCATNLLHETLGKFLVEKRLLAEADYQSTLSESVRDAVPMGDLLVKKGLLSAFDLYKQMQANLAHTILDCFRWPDARYRLRRDVPPLDNPVRMNAVQLVLTGVNTRLPFDAVATHMAFVDEQHFGLKAQPSHDLASVKLATKDVKLLQVLRHRPTFPELLQRTGWETEPLMRRLYGLAVLGLVDFVEPGSPDAVAAVDEAPSPPPPERAVPEGVPYADDDEPLRNALVQAFMSSRTQDPFELLNVPEDALIVTVRRAFLEVSDRFSPLRFRTAELREKAEALLISSARAFCELSNPEQLELWRRRRKAAREKRSDRPSIASTMVIKTQLLDAGVQLEAGIRSLAADDPKAALLSFELACDIEPKGLHLAYRGFARFKINPAAHRRLALQELQSALAQDAGCDLACFFIGEIHRAAGELESAEAAYRRAFKINPQQRKYADLLRAVLQEQKGGPAR